MSEANDEKHEQNMKQMDDAIKDARERGDKDMATKLTAVREVVTRGKG